MRRQLHIVLFGMLLFFCASPKTFAADSAEKPKTAALPNKENSNVSTKDSAAGLISPKASPKPSPSPTPNAAASPIMSQPQAQLNSQNFPEMIPGSKEKGNLSAEPAPEPEHAITQDLGTDSLSKEIALRKKMLEWSRQLGVTCNYCHNTNNFRSDEMSTFKAARKHKGTVRLLNEEVFTERDKGGALKVVADCYMCHRGRNKPEFKEPPQNLMK